MLTNVKIGKTVIPKIKRKIKGRFTYILLKIKFIKYYLLNYIRMEGCL